MTKWIGAAILSAFATTVCRPSMASCPSCQAPCFFASACCQEIGNGCGPIIQPGDPHPPGPGGFNTMSAHVRKIMVRTYNAAGACIVKNKQTSSVVIAWTNMPTLLDEKGIKYKASDSAIRAGDKLVVSSEKDCALKVAPSDGFELLDSAVIDLESISRIQIGKGKFKWVAQGLGGTAGNPDVPPPDLDGPRAK